MCHCGGILILAVWVASAPGGVPTQGRAPIPAGPERKTELKFAQGLLKARLARLDDYKRHTQDPPDVRSDALAFLQDVERKRSLAPDARSWTELAETGRKLRDRGSRDPLVMTSVNVALQQANGLIDNNALTAALWQCYGDFANSSYPALWKFEAIRNLPEKWTTRVPEGKPRSQELVAALAEAWIRDPTPAADEDDPRYRWFWLQPFIDFLDVEHQTIIRDTCLKLPDQDGWLQNLVAGTVHINLAWHHRGSDIAAKVAKKDWAEFESDLATAEKYLRNAWQINSRFPEAPSRMIAVAMGSSRAVESPRVWFDRAVAAQMDYPPAYRSYMWSLRPRWGGSFQALYAFGRECLATKRMDTDVPYMYMQALLDIDEDADGTNKVFRRDGVWSLAHPMLAAMMKQNDRGYGLRKQTQFALDLTLLGIYTGHFDDARSAFDVLEAAKVSVPFPNRFHIRENTARAIVLSTTGPAAAAARRVMPELLKLERVAEEARPAALDAMREVLANDKSEPVQKWFRSWETTLLWEQAFDAGQWVNLTFNSELDGWVNRGGKWRVENDQTIVASLPESTQGVLLTSNARFPEPFEIRASYSLPDTKKPPHAPAITINTDGHEEYDQLTRRREFWVIPEQGRAGIRDIGDRFEGVQVYVDRAGFNDLRLLVWPEQTDFYVNGQQVAIVKPTPKLPRIRVSLGLAYASNYKPPTLAFRNVRIRKLTRTPPPPQTDREGWIAYYTQSLAEDPQDANAYYRRGAAYLDQKDLAAAEADLTRAIALRPGVADYHCLLGMVAESQRDITRALRQYERASDLDFVQQTALQRIALIKAACPDAKFRDGAAAVKAAARAVEISKSKNWASIAALAAAQAESGDFGEAVKEAKKALSLAPADEQEKLKKILQQCEEGKPQRDGALEPDPTIVDKPLAEDADMADASGDNKDGKPGKKPGQKPGKKPGKKPGGKPGGKAADKPDVTSGDQAG